MGADDRFTSYGQVLAVFLTRTGKVAPGLLRRWGQWAPASWAWAYHRCSQALVAWATAAAPLAPAATTDLNFGDGRWPLPGVAAEALDLQQNLTRRA